MKKDIQDLFIKELEGILDAEEQIVEALPDMVAAADSPDLKDTFKAHLTETKGQVVRLKKIFKMLKVEPRIAASAGMKGLIKEGVDAIKLYEKSPVRDAALIAKAQRIEHFEISAYGTLKTLAKELDFDEVVDLLDDSLDEASKADKKLTKLAEGSLMTTGINAKARGAY